MHRFMLHSEIMVKLKIESTNNFKNTPPRSINNTCTNMEKMKKKSHEKWALCQMNVELNNVRHLPRVPEEFWQVCDFSKPFASKRVFGYEWNYALVFTWCLAIIGTLTVCYTQGSNTDLLLGIFAAGEPRPPTIPCFHFKIAFGGHIKIPYRKYYKTISCHR